MTLRWYCAAVAIAAISATHADALVDRADANGDGFVSLYELRAAHYADPDFNRRIEQSFADYDSNGDGLISADERREKQAEAVAAAAIPPVAASSAEPGAAGPADPPVESATITGGAAASLPGDDQLSRAESFILEIDADKSGGASIDELIASGDGQKWFTESSFKSADKNGDRDLDPDELEVLLRSLERRQH